MKLSCEHCGKRLSKETARKIGAEVMCSACLFGNQKAPSVRKEGE